MKLCKICSKPANQFLGKYCTKKCKGEDEKRKRLKLREKKRVSPKVLYKQNVEMAKTVAKIRDNYTCVHCGCKENIHGSHIINEARDHRLATYEFNIKALCYNCHLNWWHKNILEASEWFNKKFPGRYELLNKLHIEYGKEGKIMPDHHIKENERLNKILLEIKEN